MRILYGVQGTGQGHISRARAMAAALQAFPGVTVDWLFSGREKSRLFDMEPFGEFLHRQGLTFSSESGRIRYRRTLRDNSLAGFARDARSLDLSPYDLVVTDFEPVTAWAGRWQGVQTIGIGHQYAFGSRTPKAGGHWLGKAVMSQFAPVDTPVGLHWQRFEENTLPPILDLDESGVRQGEHILVYLPFEDQDLVTRWLDTCPELRFIQYAPGLANENRGSIRRRPASVHGFKRDLVSCRAVICNSGFELISECLQLGKPVLTRPVHGQVEQVSNAAALRQLGYATVTTELAPAVLQKWLARTPTAPQLRFPDVAAALAEWLARGCPESPATLSRQLWGPGLTQQTRRSFSSLGTPQPAG